MKYSIPAGSGIKILSKADEIKIPYGRISEFQDYFNQYPNASYVITIDDRTEQPNFKLLKDINKQTDLTIELLVLTQTQQYNEHNLKWFWKFPIQTFYDLQGLKDLGASQVLIDAPLFFDLPNVKKYGLKVRAVANQCYQSYIPRANGLHGCWILPQHIELYENYIYVIEFVYKNYIQLNKLIEVYKKQKSWVECCNLPFKYFGRNDIYGNMITEDLAKARIKCKQRCAQGLCHLCDTEVNLSKVIKTQMVNEFKEKISGQK